ncbi:copper amine oxidase N-terminal domain-containing protein [Paenibacillus koleovorans]|uniref:copper amine oxidase N-terminal domain-containing protein n=1 Tax=Paenibacillus koleovorans TaxID=121608 RepID=UPI000FDBE223|nr:copper amine oxidase N-terminal domain-containing protein [Paenibacillus koleovorans]
MKKYLIGAVAGAALMFSAQIFAEDGLEKIEAYLRPGLPIKLDGQKLQLENPPVMVDGSTYLPLREMAGIFGKDVHWNEAEQTVELGKRAGTVTPAATPGPTVTPTPPPIEQKPELKQLPNYSEAYEALEFDGIIYVPGDKAAKHFNLEIGYDPSNGYNFIKGTNIFFLVGGASKPGDDGFRYGDVTYLRESFFTRAKTELNK